MLQSILKPAGRAITRCRSVFAPRDVILHDGRSLRRVRVSSGMQAGVAAIAVTMLGFSGYGAASVSAQAMGTPVAPRLAGTAGRMAAMENNVAAMQAQIAAIRHTAQLHAARLEHRQALLAAALTGKGEARTLALATLEIDPAADQVAAKAIEPYRALEQRQVALAQIANRQLSDRYASTRRAISKLGLGQRVAMGGPLIEANSPEARADIAADAQFRSLFMSWKKLDTLEQGVIAIPSVQPVSNLKFTSNFGIRSDPFRGTAAMHAGVDIPGPIGTPIYATADGIVSHAGRQGGYGNMIEVNHGKGIATRYGHLSKIIVADNTRVKRGQLIGLMGSTGRSTGSHLHYEVRIDGHAVNPVPFLTTADYLLAAQDRAVGQIPVSTSGPAPQD